MSEIGETPRVPQPEQDVPQQRLEDLPEFQKLAPEQQEKLLAIRERLQSEAMNPQHVVSRSINEMGFWEGMKETVKPHLQKHKELYVKDLKAYASAALSLVPVLGEGKGLGTGLFGITLNAEKTLAQGAIKFEPLVRGKKALEFGKRGYSYMRNYSAVEHLKNAKDFIYPMSIKTALGPHQATKSEIRRAVLHDKLRPVGARLGWKVAVERSLVKDYGTAVKEGAKVLATKLGVEGIQAAQRTKAAMKKEAYQAVKIAVREVNAADKWYKFPIKWARSATGEVAAQVAKARVGKEFGKGVTSAVESAVKSQHLIGKRVEGLVKRAAPTVIEGTKLGKFHAFFDHWLNLTPDVPVWLSTTTGVMEFLGAHGIDAVPAVLQIANNRYKQVMVTKDMALDVVKYTAMKGLQKMADRKRASEVFTVPAAGTA